MTFSKSYLAKLVVRLCFRDTVLEDYHAGVAPVTKTGDYSDVMVIDAEGNKIPWDSVSRISDDEMKKLMIEAVNLTHAYLQNADNPEFLAALKHYLGSLDEWDDPEGTKIIK